MLTQTHQKFRFSLVLAEAIGIILSWFTAFYLRFHTDIIPVTKGVPDLDQYTALSVPILLVWLVIFITSGVYSSKNLMQGIMSTLHVFRMHVVAFLFFMSLTYLFSEYRFSRVTLLYFAVLSGFFLIVNRLCFHFFLRSLRSLPRFQKKIAIVGDGRTAWAFVERMERHQDLGLVLKGFLTRSGEIAEGSRYPALGKYGNILTVVESLGLDQIIIALPKTEAHVQDEILQSLTKAIVDVLLVPDIQEFLVLGCIVEELDGLPVVALNESPIRFEWLLIKRWLDILLSLAAIIILFPLLFLLAVLVKITSKGPIFYGQQRMGLDGVTFTMWKFRSMRIDAEAESGPVWAQPKDNRRTQLGTFMRATSMDELPQLWNILRGEMSLVGPRPERPQFVEQFRSSVPSYMYRHKVKAGLTGWAQINGWRGDTSLEKRIEYDLYYIRHWSLFLDLKILFLTLFKGIINKNAY